MKSLSVPSSVTYKLPPPSVLLMKNTTGLPAETCGMYGPLLPNWTCIPCAMVNLPAPFWRKPTLTPLPEIGKLA
ncbi:hypothetical protein [Lysobacter gummosus]|uniref:hypothetical protein n=1 Tax=Lysobacter gummosus TaxID=262324 RepID=UPI00362D02BB